MDQIGTLELSWAQGYNGNKAKYIDKDVICYLCGSNVKFVAEDGAETVFNFPGEGVGPFAVNMLHRCFAVAEQCLNPKIYVFIYPTFRRMSLLQGGAQLEFTKLFFSSSDYLCSLSGIPDFQLVLWNFVDGTKLCSYKLDSTIPTSLSFNPANWRQICVTTETNVQVLNIEQSDKHYIMIPQRVRLPPVDPKMNEDDDLDQPPTRASTRMTRYTVDVPKAAVAGLVGEMAERLDDIQDEVDRCKPVSQAWSAIGDVYIGCKGGQIIKVDGEVYKAKVIYYPPPPAQAPDSRVSSPGEERGSTAQLKPVDEDVSHLLLEGSANCIGLHRRGLYCAGEDGTLRLIDIKSNDCRVVEQCSIGVPITSFSFSPSYRHIALGSSRGSIHLYEAGTPESLKLLKDIHCGHFVGICCLVGNEYCVSCRDNGEIQVWTIDKGHLMSSYTIGLPVSSLACSPMVHICAVGTVTGHIYFLDLNDVESPRVVQRVRVYDGPVTHLTFDGDGKFLFSASEDGRVFVIDGRASKRFKPLAHTVVKGQVQELSVYSTGTTVHVLVSHNSSDDKRAGANWMTTFEVSDDIIRELRYNCQSLKYDFKDQPIKKLSIKLATPSYGAAITQDKTVYTMSQTNKRVHQFTMPSLEEVPKNDYFYMEPAFEYPGHQLPGGRVKLSPHHKWLASYGTDGKLMLRTIGQMDKTINITPHDFKQGGVKWMEFSDDSQHIFTTGFDGVLACYNWNCPLEEDEEAEEEEVEEDSYSPTGIGKAKSAMEAARARKSKLMTSQKEEDERVINMPDWSPQEDKGADREQLISREDRERQAREEALSQDEIYRTPTPIPAADSTWLQVQELEAFKEEDKQYADLKKNLRESIRDMRRTLQSMLKRNDTLPEIEQLNRHEFDLDIEEQQKLQAEADQEVERVREEIEFENLAKMYLREIIKRECWDDMVVKGRAVQAFNSPLEVSNFPMRERSAATKKLLEMVTRRRRIEMQEEAALDQIQPGVKKVYKIKRETVETQQKPMATTADDELGEGDDDDSKDQPATTGSLGAQYGGGSELFYSQFELHTREQKINQIVLLEDAIHRIKEVFNKDFEELFVKKEQEISKIKDKNKRIKKIIADLDLVEEVIEPSMGVAEKPETLLTVEDDEVKVEKYYTPEQRKAMEKKAKEEEERKARERGDNARDRALADMMGGVLEIKKEDELKKDIPKPAFMTTKAEADWSEEEQKLVKDYEKRVRELQEEREKFRKQLETELRKNQALIVEGMAQFDDFLNQVFMKKIKVMMVIYQEELKINRLRYSLLVEEELETREAELNRLMEHKKVVKTEAAQAVTAARKNVDAYREQYDILIAEDKVMDKAFKREFNDVTAVQQDQLYRLFRRRPRGQRATKSEAGSLESTGPNPFADRPSTARTNNQNKAYLDTAMEELDRESNCPEGVPPQVWERLCMYRRQKVEYENQVKLRANVLAEMNAFLQKRQDEDEALRIEIDSISEQLNKLRDDKTRFNLNLEVQLMLKQGQVEVSAGSFIHEYKDSSLIHRSVVEELNTTIKTLGESKIASMVESKDFRKGIIQLEWEHKKMLMQMEDFQNKMKDIQFMKVTREIQQYLNSTDYDGKKSEEVGKLELTILQLKKQHEKTTDEKKRILKDLEKTIRQKDNDNEQLLKELEDLNVSVYERRHIEDVNADQRGDTGAEKRYMEIVQRRKLVDLAKAQAQEVAVLRAEVERLRMRTFPALVQVEH